MNTDIMIIGTGAAGLFCALHLPKDKKILMITKEAADKSDSFLAQGGICVLKDESDYSSYFEDTMRAGHYENNKESVELMIRTSPEIINDLVSCGVKFEKKNGNFEYTREGAHCAPRILYNKDLTGKEITGKLLSEIRKRKNITIWEYTTMLDIVCSHNTCKGVVISTKDKEVKKIDANYVILASGGIGGLFKKSTNFPHITGDALAIALKHNIALKNINYVQIHPTTLYSEKPGRCFLISESVRGEGAVLYNSKMERFANELLPRDLLTEEIIGQMERDGTDFVWLSMKHMSINVIKNHFPNIYHHCLKEGYDITKECIPVTPAQHYHMGGIQVDLNSKTTMDHLYAIGEVSCNGVHGANRLASNSLLESLVFAKRSAAHISGNFEPYIPSKSIPDLSCYQNQDKLKSDYKKLVLKEIERINHHEQHDNKIKCG